MANDALRVTQWRGEAGIPITGLSGRSDGVSAGRTAAGPVIAYFLTFPQYSAVAAHARLLLNSGARGRNPGRPLSGPFALCPVPSAPYSQRVTQPARRMAYWKRWRRRRNERHYKKGGTRRRA
jgi:hypothetical protein